MTTLEFKQRLAEVIVQETIRLKQTADITADDVIKLVNEISDGITTPEELKAEAKQKDDSYARIHNLLAIRLDSNMCPFTFSVSRALQRLANCRTLADVYAHSESELVCVRSIGPVAMKNISRFASLNGLRFNLNVERYGFRKILSDDLLISSYLDPEKYKHIYIPED